jgi:hypothetical protein
VTGGGARDALPRLALYLGDTVHPSFRGVMALTTVLRTGVTFGVIGFALGFFGPMLATPGANQGPLLGLFITGPLGFLLGCIVGAIRAARGAAQRASQRRAYDAAWRDIMRGE